MPKPFLAPTFARALAFALFLGAPLATAAGARSATPAPDPFEQKDESVKEAYRKAIKYGVAEYEAHHFEEALGYFRRAHQLYPNARTFRGIGMASFELRDYVTAVRNLTVALADERKPLSPELRKETQDLIDRCQNFTAVYRLKLTPANTQVTVDTETPEFQPDGSLMLDLGEHVIEGRAQGHATRTLSIHVRGRERQEIVLALDPLTATSPARGPADLAPNPTVAAPLRQGPVDNQTAKVWLWTGAGLGALSVGAAIYWARQSQTLATCRAPQADYQCDNESMLVLERNIGLVGTLVTGAAAVAAVTVGILSWKSAPARPAQNAAVACAVHPFGVTCGGSF